MSKLYGREFTAYQLSSDISMFSNNAITILSKHYKGIKYSNRTIKCTHYMLNTREYYDKLNIGNYGKLSIE